MVLMAVTRDFKQKKKIVSFYYYRIDELSES